MSLKLGLGLSSLGVMGVVPLTYNFVRSNSESTSVSEESKEQRENVMEKAVKEGSAAYGFSSQHKGNIRVGDF